MNNWKEYIEQKFQPQSDFQIEDGTFDNGNGIYRLTHNLTGTIFDFIYPDEDWKKIGDVQFYNPKTKGNSGEFWESKFSEIEKKKLDDFLEPAMKTGWSSQDFYIANKHYKSYVYWNQKFTGDRFDYNTGFGCFSVLIFPYFWINTMLKKRRIISGMKEVIIEPTEKTFANNA
ncbi:hypothetical protein [Flagellimonas pacifica]|uniref:Uncharacterized protein n=1 Tax=Flagellimonas pacifica TaxID=1247520 RepID=A0A285MUU6_9FLAO|nr:hypothetical protein [Allomuricauda parva]SNZ00970.1 hypothetical protein SAMN06265377_2800 [Allomuricauda parva]